MPEITPTRSAYLELREDQRGMQEGYRFLDEKRLVLAAEALAELARYEAAWGKFRAAYHQAGLALAAAVERHGLSGVECYPPARAPAGELLRSHRSVLGVELAGLEFDGKAGRATDKAVMPSPEAEQCRERFADLLPRALELAGMASNLERLTSEYQKTSRRARALEDVLLPEIGQRLAILDAALEEQEREEAIRVRSLDRAGGLA